MKRILILFTFLLLLAACEPSGKSDSQRLQKAVTACQSDLPKDLGGGRTLTEIRYDEGERVLTFEYGFEDYERLRSDDKRFIHDATARGLLKSLGEDMAACVRKVKPAVVFRWTAGSREILEDRIEPEEYL